ncbi:MAG TPA: hypothetical protein ENK31_03000, partial [Nannocystis exedens]|nr:hypothetical protein [Nannocystis exedens]
MRRRRKLLILLGGLVAAVGLLWANFGPDLDEVVDALWWKVAPKNFRRNKVRDFHRPSGGELLLIGTGHDLHFDSDVYPLGDLVAVLDNKDPSLVLVEIRPEDLAAGYRHMGPADMAYLAGAAAERGTEVRGFDWWDLESLRTALRHYDRDPVNDETRNQHMADLINKATEGQRSVVAFTGFSHIRPLT